MTPFVPAPAAPVPDGVLSAPLDVTVGLAVLTAVLAVGVAAVLLAALAARGPSNRPSGGRHEVGDQASLPQAA